MIQEERSQRKIGLVSNENPDFLKARRLRTGLQVMVVVSDQSLTMYPRNAKVYFWCAS
jgi:hypothetical protein